LILNKTATQSPDFSHGVEERDKNNTAHYNKYTHHERVIPEAHVVQTARETEASGTSPCSKPSGQNLCGQVSADGAPGLGVDSESIRNPLDLSMGRVNKKETCSRTPWIKDEIWPSIDLHQWPKLSLKSVFTDLVIVLRSSKTITKIGNCRFGDSLRVYLFLFFLTTSYSLSAGWHDRRAEGWAWHEDRFPPKEEIPTPEPTQNPDPISRLEEIKQSLEEKKALAILEPTPEHIESYIREQNKWLNHSHDFARNWTEIVLKHPELDFTLQGVPVSQYGQRFYREQKKELRTEFINNLSQRYALLFLYEGSNPASPEVAKAVSIFSRRYNWTLATVSVDGTLCEEFPDSIVNTGLKKKLDLTIYPAVALVCPETNEVIPVAYGFVSVDKIEDNMERMFKEK
jgi:conjugal transfer pilus assembly protein TraF